MSRTKNYKKTTTKYYKSRKYSIQYYVHHCSDFSIYSNNRNRLVKFFMKKVGDKWVVIACTEMKYFNA